MRYGRHPPVVLASGPAAHLLEAAGWRQGSASRSPMHGLSVRLSPVGGVPPLPRGGPPETGWRGTLVVGAQGGRRRTGRSLALLADGSRDSGACVSRLRGKRIPEKQRKRPFKYHKTKVRKDISYGLSEVGLVWLRLLGHGWPHGPWGAWRYCPECWPHGHLQGSGWAGVDTGPHGVWFWVPRLSMPLCLRSTTRPSRWCFGDEGVSCHNTCATEALGVLDRTGQAPGQRPCAQPGRA